MARLDDVDAIVAARAAEASRHQQVGEIATVMAACASLIERRHDLGMR
ncbi:hypothetical protein [Solimonas soli]|nr:hypothetical protein [Solimonas soli]